MEAKDLTLNDIHIGNKASCSRTWEEKDVILFSQLSGDNNPLHMDSSYATTTQFGQRIVHGMLVASLCSQIVGMHIPGRRCLYLQQTVKFKHPVFIGDTVIAEGEVITKSESTRILTITIIIKKNDSIVIEGEAVVLVL